MLRSRTGTRWLVTSVTFGTLIGCGGSKDSSTAPELSAPAKFTLVSGDNQTGNGALLPTPLMVQVTDVLNRPVAGVAIAWSVSDPSATLTATSTATDDQGHAQTSWTLGAAAGRQTVTATTPSIPGAQVVFQANGGGVISGGVTTQASPPITFGTLSRGTITPPMLSAASVGGVLRPLGTAQLGARGTPTRRLIVTFRPTASMPGVGSATLSRAVMATNAHAMRGVLDVHGAAHRISAPEISPAIGAARVNVPAGVTMDDAIAALRADASVASVEVDVRQPMLPPTPRQSAATGRFAAELAAQAVAGAAAPGRLSNDPYLLYQLWHYKMIDAPRAWTLQTGSTSVLVAVVDQGVRFDHEGFAPGTTGAFTLDGYNFVTGGDRLAAPEPICNNPPGALGATTKLHENGPGPDATLPDDVEFDASRNCWYRFQAGDHGLHVSGTIGAAGNDGVGVTGINWQVRIRPVRVLDITGSGSWFDVAQGILYAAGLPAAKDTLGGTVTAPSRAPIINMSLGGGGTSSVVRNAVTAATNAGSLIIASAGNAESSAPQYPAGYPEVLAVTALGPDLSISSFTNVGGNVSLAAPGGNSRSGNFTSLILSTTWDYVNGRATYGFYEGTSMAAPHVSGVAALVLATSPGLTNTQLRNRLQSTAVHMGAPGRNDQYGYGIVNAYNAITNSNGPPRKLYARVNDAATGSMIQTVAVGADGSFSFSRLPPGSYYVYAGEDESSDGNIGVPGRRFGWYGGATGPTPVTITAGGNGAASISVGTPLETKPHLTMATANLLVPNSYIVGQLTATDGPAIYKLIVPRPATYYLEAGAVLGTCGFGIELNTVLELYDAQGGLLATNDDAGSAVMPGLRFCSAITTTLQSGTYFLRVSGSTSLAGPPMPTGQYRVWVRDTP